MTKWFQQYLRDYAAALERQHIEQWKEGNTDLMTDAERRARVLVNNEVAGMEFAHIEAFYAEPDDEEYEENQT